MSVLILIAFSVCYIFMGRLLKASHGQLNLIVTTLFAFVFIITSHLYASRDFYSGEDSLWQHHLAYLQERASVGVMPYSGMRPHHYLYDAVLREGWNAYVDWIGQVGLTLLAFFISGALLGPRDFFPPPKRGRRKPPTFEESLHYAARDLTPKKVKELVNCGYEINKIDPTSRWTPLMYAAAFGREDNVKTLLSLGADIDLKNQEGLTAVFLAARSPEPEITSLFIDAGAKLNIRDIEGMTPLHYACKSGVETNVRQLIAAGADPSIKDNDGQPPSYYAYIYNRGGGHEQILKFFDIL